MNLAPTDYEILNKPEAPGEPVLLHSTFLYFSLFLNKIIFTVCLKISLFHSSPHSLYFLYLILSFKKSQFPLSFFLFNFSFLFYVPFFFLLIFFMRHTFSWRYIPCAQDPKRINIIVCQDTFLVITVSGRSKCLCVGQSGQNSQHRPLSSKICLPKTTLRKTPLCLSIFLNNYSYLHIL